VNQEGDLVLLSHIARCDFSEGLLGGVTAEVRLRGSILDPVLVAKWIAPPSVITPAPVDADIVEQINIVYRRLCGGDGAVEEEAVPLPIDEVVRRLYDYTEDATTMRTSDDSD
jgi:hypothetical protein